ncbi:hypothetical protein BpHYR1_002436 [Brachionus plicatilis]|uniref:Uncharacterized protein n=1 Tax=Brachionus plicatilis TaxID=10195 RepID=A0A3M7QWL6_BRAPC|nr:hypothetical protein BpHYR1_002436 [Brachionus plicatilis]
MSHPYCLFFHHQNLPIFYTSFHAELLKYSKRKPPARFDYGPISKFHGSKKRLILYKLNLCLIKRPNEVSMSTN